MGGSAVGGLMVFTAAGLPGRLNWMTSASGLALAWTMAARSEPGVGLASLPLSTTVLTFSTAGTQRSSRASRFRWARRFRCLAVMGLLLGVVGVRPSRQSIRAAGGFVTGKPYPRLRGQSG